MSDGFRLGNGKDFYHQQFPETKYLVDGFLECKTYSILSGDTGIGKSLIAHQIGIALSGGLDEILGFSISKKRRVLYFNFELSMQEFNKRHKLIANGLGCMDDLEKFQFNIVGKGRGIFQDNWSRIKETVKENERFDLIIVDNLYASTNGDDEKNFQLKLILHDIFDVAGIHDSGILIVNHHKKHSEEDPLSINMIRGGSNLVNAAHSVIQLGRSLQDKDMRYLKVTKSRGASEYLLKPLGLMFDDTTLLFENTWDFDEIYHLSRTNRVQDNVLYNLPDKFASKEFVKEVANNGLNMKTAYTWLNDLKEKGHIEKIAHGRYVKRGI